MGRPFDPFGGETLWGQKKKKKRRGGLLDAHLPGNLGLYLGALRGAQLENNPFKGLLGESSPHTKKISAGPPLKSEKEDPAGPFGGASNSF